MYGLSLNYLNFSRKPELASPCACNTGTEISSEPVSRLYRHDCRKILPGRDGASRLDLMTCVKRRSNYVNCLLLSAGEGTRNHWKQNFPVIEFAPGLKCLTGTHVMENLVLVHSGRSRLGRQTVHIQRILKQGKPHDVQFRMVNMGFNFLPGRSMLGIFPLVKREAELALERKFGIQWLYGPGDTGMRGEKFRLVR